ncbi:hypothetical protein T08_2662 [Trichinella sp. T8]|nr:hypothetical protein T08_2662 [Trichinella sp. T8]
MDTSKDNESLPANGPKQHSVQPAPVQKQSSDIYLNATLVEEKFIEFVEYFIRRVIISKVYSNIRIFEIVELKTGPIRTVVVRQKATVDKLAMNESIQTTTTTTTVAGIFKLYKYEYGNEIQFGNPQIQRGYR